MYSISPSPGNQTLTLLCRWCSRDFFADHDSGHKFTLVPFARSPLSSSSVRESQVSTLWILHAILWLQQRNIDDTTSDRHLLGPMVLFSYSLLFVLPPTLCAELLSLEPLWGSRADSLPPTPLAIGCVTDCSYCLCTCLWNRYCSFQIKLQPHYEQGFIFKI